MIQEKDRKIGCVVQICMFIVELVVYKQKANHTEGKIVIPHSLSGGEKKIKILVV